MFKKVNMETQTEIDQLHATVGVKVATIVRLYNAAKRAEVAEAENEQLKEQVTSLLDQLAERGADNERLKASQQHCHCDADIIERLQQALDLEVEMGVQRFKQIERQRPLVDAAKHVGSCQSSELDAAMKTLFNVACELFPDQPLCSDKARANCQ